jgi:hypothetical protein
MTDNIELELISRRRAFSLLGLTAAFGLAAPATVLTVTDVEAQQPAPDVEPQTRAPGVEPQPRAPNTEPPTSGMTRR